MAGAGFGVIHRLLANVFPENHPRNHRRAGVGGPAVDIQIPVPLPMAKIEGLGRTAVVGQQVTGQVVHLAVIVGLLGGGIIALKRRVRIGERVLPHDVMAKGHVQHRAVGRFVSRQRQQIRDAGRERHSALLGGVRPHIELDRVAPQVGDRLRRLHQQRVAGKLVGARERFRAHAHVVAVHRRV